MIPFFFAAGILFLVGRTVSALGGGFKVAGGFVEFCGGVCAVVAVFWALFEVLL